MATCSLCIYLKSQFRLVFDLIRDPKLNLQNTFPDIPAVNLLFMLNSWQNMHFHPLFCDGQIGIVKVGDLLEVIFFFKQFFFSCQAPIKVLLRGKKLKKGESSKKKIKIEKTSSMEVGVVAQAGPKNTCGAVFKSGTHTAAKRLWNGSE